jgi:hypothetical protein
MFLGLYLRAKTGRRLGCTVLVLVLVLVCNLRPVYLSRRTHGLEFLSVDETPRRVTFLHIEVSISHGLRKERQCLSRIVQIPSSKYRTVDVDHGTGLVFTSHK